MKLFLVWGLLLMDNVIMVRLKPYSCKGSMQEGEHEYSLTKTLETLRALCHEKGNFWTCLLSLEDLSDCQGGARETTIFFKT